MNVYRYPLNAPVPGNGSLADGPTGMTDYVMFQRQRINYDDSSTSYFGHSFSNTDIKVSNAGEGRCYLAMPKALQTQYQPQYRQVDLGVAGVAGVTAMANEQLTTDNLSQIVSGAAAASIPEFASSTIAQTINGFSGLLGLAGNVDANSIQALTRGRVFNPFKEQIFQNMAFRTHSFQFKLFSRSIEEAREVKNIITYFKAGATPGMEGVDGATGFSSDLNEALSQNADIFSSNEARLSSKNRFFRVPDQFKIKFLRMDPNGTFQSESSSMHFSIHPSVCTGITVNYTPDGQYTAFKDADTQGGVAVPAINLAMTFTELKLVTQSDILRGGF